MLPTDRGYVLVQPNGDAFDLKIFASHDDGGAPDGLYAIHAGLTSEQFSIDDVPVVETAEGTLTTDVAEVFADEVDNVVHVRSVSSPASFPSLT